MKMGFCRSLYHPTSMNRVRNPGMAGGYPQQGYQTRPPASWASPGVQMQPGYEYLQPGAYPGPSPQYNMSQLPYPGYPPQPASGGYASGWDQTTAPNQQMSQAGGAGHYDYYNQQAASQQQQTPAGSAASTDTTAYGYNQPSATGFNQGQSYSQDGYGGYHAPAAQSGYQGTGYDQQRGYSSTPGYGNVLNPVTTLHMVCTVMAVKHLHQFSHQAWVNKAINLARSPALILVTHLKALLKLGMGCHLFPKVAMAPSQQQVMALVMGPLKLKSLQPVSQLMVSLSNLLLHKVAMPNLHRCSPGIHSYQLLDQVMVRVILGFSDLYPPMALQQLTLGMVFRLSRPATGSHCHLTVVPMLVVMCSLRHHTLLMAVVVQIRHASLFNLVLGEFQKPHLRVNGHLLGRIN